MAAIDDLTTAIQNLTTAVDNAVARAGETVPGPAVAQAAVEVQAQTDRVNALP